MAISEPMMPCDPVKLRKMVKVQRLYDQFMLGRSPESADYMSLVEFAFIFHGIPREVTVCWIEQQDNL